MDIFSILSLPVQEHKVYFHLFVSSAVSFINVLQFSVYRSYNSLVKFIQKYFTVFHAIANGITLLISLGGGLFLVYRNATDIYVCGFCILQIYINHLLSFSEVIRAF